jgi:hypothetical protein
MIIKSIKSSHPSTSPKRRGYAMLSVLVFLAVGLVFVAVQQRRLGAWLRLEQSRIEAARFDEGPRSVMAGALELLETGLPPTDPYECGALVDTSDGPRTFSVLFWSSGGKPWTIEVTPRADLTGLPAMPLCFAP